ncbi:MAG: hypothetical protein U0822_01015 [Anaerolineae bacterium]
MKKGYRFPQATDQARVMLVAVVMAVVVVVVMLMGIVVMLVAVIMIMGVLYTGLRGRLPMRHCF